jgi:hypothetical protein
MQKESLRLQLVVTALSSQSRPLAKLRCRSRWKTKKTLPVEARLSSALVRASFLDCLVFSAAWQLDRRRVVVLVVCEEELRTRSCNCNNHHHRTWLVATPTQPRVPGSVTSSSVVQRAVAYDVAYKVSTRTHSFKEKRLTYCMSDTRPSYV